MPNFTVVRWWSLISRKPCLNIVLFSDYFKLLYNSRFKLNYFSEYVNELQNFYPVLTSWAGIEPVLRPLLLDVGVAEENIAAGQTKHLISSYQITFCQVCGKN